MRLLPEVLATRVWDACIHRGRTDATLGRSWRGLGFLRLAHCIATLGFSAHDLRGAETCSAIAMVWCDRGAFARGFRHALRAVAIVRMTMGSQHPTYAQYMTRLAWVRVGMGRYLDAISTLQATVGVYTRMGSAGMIRRFAVWRIMGDWAMLAGDGRLARPARRRAYDLSAWYYEEACAIARQAGLGHRCLSSALGELASYPIAQAHEPPLIPTLERYAVLQRRRGHLMAAAALEREAEDLRQRFHADTAWRGGVE